MAKLKASTRAKLKASTRNALPASANKGTLSPAMAAKIRSKANAILGGK